MNKLAFLSSLLLTVLSISFLQAQSTESNKRLALNYIEKAAPIIIDCCASYPKEIEPGYISQRKLNNGRLLIRMSVKWTSDTATNCHYKIEGELTVDMDGCNPRWLYKDSNKNLGCFIRPGCRWTCSANFSECL